MKQVPTQRIGPNAYPKTYMEVESVATSVETPKTCATSRVAAEKIELVKVEQRQV